jgi:predicted DNA-binding ribbon-helix-helix protein
MRKAKADVIQSTLRLPRAIWQRINHIAAYKNLSMQQAIQEAVLDYCRKFTNERKGGRS